MYKLNKKNRSINKKFYRILYLKYYLMFVFIFTQIDLGLLAKTKINFSILLKDSNVTFLRYVRTSKCSFAFLYTCGDFNKLILRLVTGKDTVEFFKLSFFKKICK